jgi:hypothetical protein
MGYLIFFEFLTTITSPKLGKKPITSFPSYQIIYMEKVFLQKITNLLFNLFYAFNILHVYIILHTSKIPEIIKKILY